MAMATAMAMAMATAMAMAMAMAMVMAMASFTADDDGNNDDDHEDLHVVLVESPAPDTKVVTQLVWEDALWNDTHTSLDLPPAIYCHI